MMVAKGMLVVYMPGVVRGMRPCGVNEIVVLHMQKVWIHFQYKALSSRVPHNDLMLRYLDLRTYCITLPGPTGINSQQC